MIGMIQPIIGKPPNAWDPTPEQDISLRADARERDARGKLTGGKEKTMRPTSRIRGGDGRQNADITYYGD